MGGHRKTGLTHYPQAIEHTGVFFLQGFQKNGQNTQNWHQKSANV